MASRGKTKRQTVREFVEARGGAPLGAADWFRLRDLLTPVSTAYLRDLVRAAGADIEPPYGGVRQHTYEDLERSLVELQNCYVAATERGDRQTAALCRQEVITARRRARAQSRSLRLGTDARSRKQEMQNWMLVWLENPPLFETWVKLRRARGALPGLNGPGGAADQ